MLHIFRSDVHHPSFLPFKPLHAVFAAVNSEPLEVCCYAITLTTVMAWLGSFLSPLAAVRRTLPSAFVSVFISTTISSLVFFSLVLLKQTNVGALLQA